MPRYPDARLTRRWSALVSVLSLVSGGAIADEHIDGGADDHSFANPAVHRVRHAELDLDVDFRRKVLSGTVELTVERETGSIDDLVLDTRDLVIRDVWWVRKNGSTVSLDFRLGPSVPHLGQPLRVRLADIVPANLSPFKIRISYQTHPIATGLQWLDPAQTTGGEHPFLFTQSQAIHARSWIPLQDTPTVRLTFDATIHTPKSLVAVMSADNDPEAPRNGEYLFSMPQPIPSYLIALAVGNFEFRAIGDMTGVYAEPELLASAAREFEDTEQMLVTSEELFGPYAWGRYDLLILPPSFPFGGMENPKLSFITPTIIAGDKSLVALIAHELAHSWSGNLVTNATWGDLWLNEGFTVYFESRIMEAIYGVRREKMEAVLGYQALEEDFDELDRADEALAVDLSGRDPDDGFTHVPYEKGRLFLKFLESRFGREVFDAFLRDYFEDHAFQSVTTTAFIDYVSRNLLDTHPGIVSRQDVEEWIFDSGLPDDAVLPESDAFELVAAERDAWLEGDKPASDIDSAAWTVHEWLYFLNTLPVPVEQDQLVELDGEFGLTGSLNNEIAHSWLKIAIISDYRPAFDRLETYLTGIGRIKLVKPLYEELVKSEEGRELALKIFANARPGYHPLTTTSVEAVVRP